MADIYFSIYIIQLNFDIFILRNRNFKSQKMQRNNQNENSTVHSKEATNVENGGNKKDDLAIFHHELLREEYESKCKHFFILRDKYLLTKV